MLYFHIPFCRKACHYCDFHFSTSLENMENMIKAINVEIEIRAKNCQDKEPETIYFGGGTPSILKPEMLGSIFETLHHHFNFGKIREITLEANPDDVTKINLNAWKTLGINRLSIGLQSSNNQRLTWMNRLHSYEEGKAAVFLAQDSGIDNISLDLMYNFPESTSDELETDIQALVQLSPKHISAYSLTIEPDTVFGNRLKKGHLSPLPEESAALQFQQVANSLQNSGFESYEISNFCLPGYEAVHNTNYWFQKPYLAFGPGGHGFDGKARYENLPNNSLYIKKLLNESSLLEKSELLSNHELANEIIITRLRTKWGISNQDFNFHTGIDLLKERSKILKGFIQTRLLTIENETIQLTREGKLLADKISMELLF